MQPRVECANGDKDGLCWVPTSQNPVTARRSHSGVGHYQDVIEGRSNYDLLVKHQVLRVVYGESPEDGPPRVEMRNLETNEVQLVTATAEVVLSAGAAHTPLILQRSGIASKEFLRASGVDVVVHLPGQLLARGTWDYELVDELKPQPGDISLHKTRYSGFFNSQLDSVLRSRGIRNLVFVGIATNVCVESTLRDGFFLEYFGVVLEDATHQAGPDFVQQASLYNIEKFFGWVSSVADFKGVVGQIAPATPQET